jgi:hypothetical protein
MPRKPRAPRLSDVIMDELVGDHAPWDLDKHLSGCLAGYQTDPSYGAAVYFALEVLSGIARDVAIRADSGAFGPNQLDAYNVALCPSNCKHKRLELGNYIRLHVASTGIEVS